MATDWNNLRPWNGSREKGFEELCCQLAAGELNPAGSAFVRKGAPDAGVECFWTLPGGDEHGWQAKFFTCPPTPSQWSQIDESVETALEKHRRLTQYTVCLPLDRPDARLKGQKSFLEKWNERVGQWNKWAAKKKLKVEFKFWGDHELTSRLSRDENRGRHWFWFNHEQFTLEWFRKKLRAAIENAGERYSPVLHVDLPVASYFWALGRTPRFHDSLNAAYQKVRRTANLFTPDRLPTTLKEAGIRAQAAIERLSQLFDDVLLPVRDPWVVAAPAPIRWDDFTQVAKPLQEDLGQTSSALWGQIFELQQERSERPADSSRQEVRTLREAAYHCGELNEAVSDLIHLCNGIEAQVANRPALLMVGEAGQGKTHLLCDIAEKDLADNRPRILLHGSHFTDAEPWSQVVQLLGLNCSTDKFLGALEAAGQAYGCRILILIDALNEGEGRGLWQKHLPGMLSTLASTPWVGIAVSVRSSYESVVIPECLVPDRLTRIIHPGLEEHEYEAVNRFFVHYGIQPTVPLLIPEFTNPLFLKLFCQGVKANGWTQVPLGLRGITAILNMFLSAVNKKLSNPTRMDYDVLSDPVQKAIDALIRLMAQSGSYWLPRDQAVEAVNNIHKVDGYDRSLFRNLVTEGVLTENRRRGDEDHTDVVSFAYERFADHLLAKHLLANSLDRKAAKKSFGPQTRLGKLVKSEIDCFQHAGLLEALSVQLPELIGKELFEVAPHAAKFSTVQDGFIKSLVWRDSKAFTESTFKQINKLCRWKMTLEEILNAALTVAPVPEHPFNADKLHQILSDQEMADRDAWWNVFLHSEWRQGKAVTRLVDWTWGESDKSCLSEPVILLTGTALAWFLTSSNRFLRDSATKALVKLFENRLALLRTLLNRFWEVNDPYVLERLLAAAYGSCMRSQDVAGIADLAADVSKHVFQEESVLPQVLTRDYARGIIECALHRSTVPLDAFPEHRPPYKSEWPNMTIPSEEDLEKWGKWWEKMPDVEWARQELYCSIMGDGISDFSRYVVGDLTEWTTVRLGATSPKSVKEQFDDFVSQLRSSQRQALNQFQVVSENVRILRQLSPEEREEHFQHRITDDELEAILAGTESKVVKSLKSRDQLRFFRTVAKPFIENPDHLRLSHVLDAKLARRWMFQRTLDYGWTMERFGEFDRMVNRWSKTGREAHKAERIGKKYQWIAYHELLARLSDNFYMRQDCYSDKGLREYSGPWDIGYGSARDIDPSVLIRITPADRATNRAWWSQVGYSGVHGSGDNVDWLKATDDLPAIEPLLSVECPKDGSQWYVLDIHREWTQPARAGRREYDLPQRQLWYIIRSYIVRRTDAAAFFRWAKRKDFMGTRMPEAGDVYHIYLGEYFWAPAYRETISEYGTAGWTRGWSDEVPTEVLLTSCDFSYSSSGLDCSVDTHFHLKLPTGPIASGMQLRWGGSEGQYVDQSGRLALFDPSVFEPGPRALLVRQDAFQKYLVENDFELFWTLLGEKQIIGGGSRGDSGWLQMSGVYRLTNRGIRGQRMSEYRLTAAPRPRARNRGRKK